MQPICECPVNSVVKYRKCLWAVVEFIGGEYHLQGEGADLYLAPDIEVELIATPAVLALWFAGVR